MLFEYDFGAFVKLLELCDDFRNSDDKLIMRSLLDSDHNLL